MHRVRTARAIAHANIALVKYWGKRPGADLNLPAVGSLSMTLDQLRTETVVGPAPRDAFQLDGQPVTGPAATRAFRHLDRLWQWLARDAPRPPMRIASRNFVPTAAGLASSASGFAALTLAGAAALSGRLDTDRGTLSTLARRGSGSAARSLWGGFVRLDRGRRDDGADCRARPLFPADHWDLRLVIVHTARGPKGVGSTEGMVRSEQTSPYYPAWVEHAEADLDRAERALAERDLTALGAVVEHSCFKMHACMMASQPPLLYWNGTTLEVIRALWAARAELEGALVGYATSDAGPHVKVLCQTQAAPSIAARLRAVPGVQGIDIVAPGPDARVDWVEEARL